MCAKRKSQFQIKVTQLRGEHHVAEKLCELGWQPLLMTEGTPGVDIISLNEVGDDIRIQVKSRASGSWHAKTTDGDKKPQKKCFWVFVDFTIEPTRSFICPDAWIRNDIRERYQEYLDKHGGKRPITPTATHHAIRLNRIEEWEDRWDLIEKVE
jgi:hypothetical protein